jgi:hypothetical protein
VSVGWLQVLRVVHMGLDIDTVNYDGQTVLESNQPSHAVKGGTIGHSYTNTYILYLYIYIYIYI